jgi:hypothetical protein
MSNTYADFQDFYGSDGTRTRDLRRDRPVSELAAWAWIGGNSRHEQGVSHLVLRGLPCACGDLVRDQGGMLRCLSCNQREVGGTRRV